jgi:hypothetical protein
MLPGKVLRFDSGCFNNKIFRRDLTKNRVRLENANGEVHLHALIVKEKRGK